MLIPPKSLITTDGNPYLFLGGLEQALAVLSVRLSSGAAGEQILQGNAGESYAVEKDPTSSGPIMVITTEGESPESALTVLDDVLNVVPQSLEAMQDQLNIPAASRITVMTIVREGEPKLVLKTQLRAVLAAVAVGVSMTVLLTGLLDRLLSSRKRNARRRQSPDVSDEPQDHNSGAGLRLGRAKSGEVQMTDDPSPSPESEKEDLPTLASNK